MNAPARMPITDLERVADRVLTLSRETFKARVTIGEDKKFIGTVQPVFVDLRAAVAELDLYTDNDWPRLARACAAQLHNIIAHVEAGVSATTKGWSLMVRDCARIIEDELELYQEKR
jgi:hypothetical protein